ncbi:hypothetical protein J3369_10540 [Alteromonas sp. NFXS44]|uniref:hypothetical protein n=1 Tax=Alteromonas sp. NFXS44 TaxID=2818435 RepID=UPI0032DE5B12
MKKFLPLLTPVFLFACQPENNMAGLDRVYVTPVTLSCVAETIHSEPFVSGFKATDDVFHFNIDGYETRMLNKTLGGKISGYAMTINGMHKGDEPNAFYKIVREFETQIYTHITERCYGKSKS